MKKVFLLAIIFMFFNVSLLADEIKNRPEKKEYNAVKNELEKNPTKGLNLIKNYQTKYPTKYGEGFTNLLLGSYFYYNGQIPKSDSVLHVALHIFENLKDIKGILVAKSNIAIIKQINGDFEFAIKTLQENIPFLIKIKDTLNIANTYNNIASIFYMLKDYEKAEDYYKLALPFYKLKNNDDGTGLVLSKLGSIKFDTYDFNKAEYFFNMSKKVYEKSNNIYGVGKIYIRIGDIFYEKYKNLDSALVYYLKADKIYKDLGAECNLTFSAMAIADVYYQFKKYNLSQKYIKIAEEKANLCEYNYVLPEVYQNSYEIEKEMGNTNNALHYLELSTVLKDSIYNIEKTEAISDIEAKYQTEKKEKKLTQNKLQLSQKNLVIQKQSKQFMFITIILVGIISLFLITFLFYKKQQKLNKQLQELNDFKNQVFRIIGHDLRTPLSNIITTTKEKQTQQKAYTVLNVLDNLLTWSNYNNNKITSNVQEVSLGMIIDELKDEFKLLFEEKNITIKESFKNEKTIMANKDEVIIVLRNLLINAIKYSPINSQIIIKQTFNEFIIQNEVDNNIKHGSKIGLKIVKDLINKNNFVFVFENTNPAVAKIIFND